MTDPAFLWEEEASAVSKSRRMRGVYAERRDLREIAVVQLEWESTVPSIRPSSR